MRVRDVKKLPFIDYLINFSPKEILSQLKFTYNNIKIWIINLVRKAPYVGVALNRRELRVRIFAALAKDALDFQILSQKKSNAEAIGLQNPGKQPSNDSIQHNPQYHEMLDRLRSIQLQFDLRNLEPSILSLAQTLPIGMPVAQTRNAAISVELETEIIRRCSGLFGGSMETSGFVAANSRDAIFASLRAYSDNAARTRRISQPEVIIFATAHSDFTSATVELANSNIKLTTLGVHPQTQMPDLVALEKSINSNTVLIVASVPSCITGAIDPVAELSKIAQSRGVDLHVDAVGSGLLLPWATRFDPTIPAVGFSLEGVSSIAISAHKSKTEGPVVVMFRNKEITLLHTQTNQVGMLKTALAIQREGRIAEAWATVVYRENTNTITLTKTILDIKDKLVEGIQQIVGLEVLAEPKLGIITVRSDKFNVLRVAKRMKEIGWTLDYSSNVNGQKVFIISLSGDNAMDMNCAKFIQDLNSAVAFVEATPQESFMGSVVLFSMKSLKPTVRNFMLDLADDSVRATPPDTASSDTMMSIEQGGAAYMADRVSDQDLGQEVEDGAMAPSRFTAAAVA